MSRPAKRMLPASGSSRPQSRLTKVVLPAPFGPISAWMPPSREVEVDPGDRLHPAEGAGEAAGLEQGHGSQGSARARTAPSSPRGANSTSASSASPTTRSVASVTREARSTR